MIGHWLPEYDDLVTRYHAIGLTDHQIHSRMLDQDIPVSHSDVVAARRNLRLRANAKASLFGHPLLVKHNRLPSGPRPICQAERLPKERINPLALAKRWLGARLVEKPTGYWLDGLPVNLPAIMKETNRLFLADGMEQIGPEGWRVPAHVP